VVPWRRSRSETFRIARKHGRLANVVQSEVEHGDPLHSNATAGVRRSSIAERVDVRLYLVKVCDKNTKTRLTFNFITIAKMLFTDL